MQRSGVWVAVLLIHVFLWIALEKGREVPKPRQHAFTYLSVIPIDLKDPPIREHVIRDVDIPERKIAISKAHIKKKKEKELVNAEEISVLQKFPSPPVNDGSSKKTKTLNYDAMKQTALSIAHESENRLLPGIDRKLSRSEKFAKTADEGKRSDCRSAYAGLLLLAIPLLLKDTILDSGCKW